MVGKIVLFTSATDNFDNITLEHFFKVKTVIVDSIGHFDNDIGLAWLVGFPGVIPQVDRFAFPEGLQEAGGDKVTCTVEERNTLLFTLRAHCSGNLGACVP